MLRDGMIFLFPRIAEADVLYSTHTGGVRFGPATSGVGFAADCLRMPCLPVDRGGLGDFSPTAPDAGVDLQTGAQAAGLGAVVSHRDDNTDPASPWHAGCSVPGKVMTSNGFVKPMFPPSGLEPWRRVCPFFSLDEDNAYHMIISCATISYHVKNG